MCLLASRTANLATERKNPHPHARRRRPVISLPAPLQDQTWGMCISSMFVRMHRRSSHVASPFDTLPDEVLVLIFNHLDVVGLARSVFFSVVERCRFA